MKRTAKIINIVFAFVGFALAALSLAWNCTACAGEAKIIANSFELIVVLKTIAYLLMPICAVLANKKMNEADSKADVKYFEMFRLAVAAIMLIVVAIGFIVGFIDVAYAWFYLPMVVGNAITPVLVLLIPAEKFVKRRI